MGFMQDFLIASKANITSLSLPLPFLQVHSFLALASSHLSGQTGSEVWFGNNSAWKYWLLTSAQPDFSCHIDSSVSGQSGETAEESDKWRCSQMYREVTFHGNGAKKRTDVVMISLPALLGGGSVGLRQNAKYTTCCCRLDYCFFINSTDAPLATCVFFLTSYCSCYSCCFRLSSALLFLLPVAVVPTDEAVLRHRDTSWTFLPHGRILQWPFAVHTVAEIAHWLHYPATSFLKKKKKEGRKGMYSPSHAMCTGAAACSLVSETLMRTDNFRLGQNEEEKRRHQTYSQVRTQEGKLQLTWDQDLWNSLTEKERLSSGIKR